MEDKDRITEDMVVPILETKYLKVFDLQYAEGCHYIDATRRNRENLVAVKSPEAFQTMAPDAVTCVVILAAPGEEPRLLLDYEYRYPAGQYLLSPPAGLIDPEDLQKENPILETAKRELKEETGLEITEEDELFVINPLLFSSPGMTDESNALAGIILHSHNPAALDQTGAVGSEKFDGFVMPTVEEAKKLLTDGRDEKGNFFSVYTWCALSYFVGRFGKN